MDSMFLDTSMIESRLFIQNISDFFCLVPGISGAILKPVISCSTKLALYIVMGVGERQALSFAQFHSIEEHGRLASEQRSYHACSYSRIVWLSEPNFLL